MDSLRCIVSASLLLIPVVTWSASRSQRSNAKEGDVLVYYCHNLSIATVRVVQHGVSVETESRKTTLLEMPPSSRVRYSDGTVTLSSLEEQVRFDEPGAAYFCRRTPAEIPWQEARLRGIEFRAAGENPEWSLEFDSGKAVEFSTGVGEARTVTRFPPAELAGKDGRMTLTSVSLSGSLTVLAEQRVCSVAGSTMTLAVTVTLDGKTYRGCGHNLTPPLP